MGTGKSTVGRLLADRFGFDFVDTDQLIEERHGSIRTIFAEQGEAAFRALERELAAELAERSQVVIATGGRLMLDPENIASLGAGGRVFCLVADPGEIERRIVAEADTIERPLLAAADPRARINELLAERRSGYARFTQVATDGRTPEDIAAEIAASVSSPPGSRSDRTTEPGREG